MVAMTSPLQRAVGRPFWVCQLLHFCQLLSNPSINLKLEYIFGKPMKRRFQRCTVHTEISPTFHARVKCISVTKYAIETIGPMGANNPKIHVDLHLIHECLGWPHTTPNDSSIGARTSTQLCNKRPTDYNGTSQIHPINCPFSFDDHHPQPVHPSLDQPHSPPQTASKSNQPLLLLHPDKWLDRHQSHIR